MLIHQIAVKNLLSFGPEGIDLLLRPLNVLIGPNGSGKSNLLEAISLLQSAPKLLASPVKDGGGISDWLWKGDQKSTATLAVHVDNPDGRMPLYHSLSFTETARRFDLVDERIEDEQPHPGKTEPYFYYRFQDNCTF